MQDDLKKIFNSYNPRLTSDNRFMTRLESNLRAIDAVKGQLAKQRRQSRLAVAVAAITGLVSGIILTLIYPNIASVLSHLCLSITSASSDVTLPNMLSLLFVALAASTLSYTAYDITLLASRVRER